MSNPFNDDTNINNGLEGRNALEVIPKIHMHSARMSPSSMQDEEMHRRLDANTR